MPNDSVPDRRDPAPSYSDTTEAYFNIRISTPDNFGPFVDTEEGLGSPNPEPFQETNVSLKCRARPPDKDDDRIDVYLFRTWQSKPREQVTPAARFETVVDAMYLDDMADVVDELGLNDAK